MVDRRIRLHCLRAFEAAARNMHFTRAAEELGVSQSAVSHQIQQLENHVGKRLFLRRNRKLELSEAGRALLPEVQKGFAHFSRGLDAVAALSSSGRVNVDVTPRFALKWLARRLRQFTHRYPTINVNFHQSTKTTDFSTSNADIAIEWHLVEPHDRITHLLVPSRFSPVCSPELLSGPYPLNEPSDIRHHTVLFERDGRTWLKWFEVAGCPGGFTVTEGVAIDDGNIRVQAALDGQGIDLGSLELLTDELQSGRLVQPFDAVLHAGGYYLTYPADAMSRPRPRLFIEWLLEEVGG